MPRRDTQSLPGVLKEISGRLLADDWVRMQSPDGTHFYYVVGANAWSHERETGALYHMLVQTPSEVSASGEYYVKAQLAAASDASVHLEKASDKAKSVGLDVGTILERLESRQFANDIPTAGHLQDDWLEAFADLIEAFLIHKASTGDLLLNPQLRADLANAREKLFLQEIVQRYQKVVKRTALLDPLPFRDEVLAEAIRCYLYGFYRAAIVIGAGALERHLKNAQGPAKWSGYDAIVNAVWAAKRLGEDTALREAAKQVFTARNRVIHTGSSSSKDEAEKTLDLVRKIIEHLVSFNSS